ncbi:MAG: hypothetical protein O3B41_09390 [Bacteroidetes bacterium]|nr:hypothetical protein [Bacteroidota bacterium]
MKQMKSGLSAWIGMVGLSCLLAACATSQVSVPQESPAPVEEVPAPVEAPVQLPPDVPAPLDTPEVLTDGQISSRITATLSEVFALCKMADGSCGLSLDPGSAADSIAYDRTGSSITAYLNKSFAQKAFRETDVQRLTSQIQEALFQDVGPLGVNLEVLGRPLRELIPNYYRTTDLDRSRMPQTESAPRRLTTDMGKPWQNRAQLSGRHIAIWPSHGWYYEYRLDRWEWQRARLFQTVEDLFPMAFVAPYLIPMLEGAGAYVHIPRERDTQVNEVVVDNDSESSPSSKGANSANIVEGSRFLEVGKAAFAWKRGPIPGFRVTDTLVNQNPFSLGSYRVSRTDAQSTAMTSWIPAIPEKGAYAVYVSYGKEANATSEARYTVFHLGGETEVRVDQRMMGATWVYLGTFEFESGAQPESGRVELTNQSADVGKTLSADAVRFGGGMGSIERGGKTSGRPRFAEGARYYMQYAGMPRDLVYNVTEDKDDYIDDYRGRAEWVNYLKGAPFGPNKNRLLKGLDVPIDLSLAFHTDAGIAKADTTIGTLMIYSSTGSKADGSFPDGMSRIASRDLGDIMQSTIVSDLQQKYDSTWTRRAIWDRDYSEAVRPNVPGVLLELLSHQNFADMKFGLDPRFKFDVARSVYKSMAYFLASQNGYEAVIQPLPVTHMKAEWTTSGAIEVTWKPQADPLEPSALPTQYSVQMRTDGGGYGEGQVVNEPRFLFRNPKPGSIYAFRVAGINEGGEGFAGEEVAAGRPSKTSEKKEVLVIAGFDRISAPESVDSGAFRGFADFLDEGVPDRKDIAYVGRQHDFNVDSIWSDDDSPGHGASYSTFETQVLTGNTFDYPALHGKSILRAGHAFATASDESVASGEVNLARYGIVDLILGEEKRVKGPGRLDDFEAIPPSLQARLSSFSSSGGSIIATGAHIATDLAGPAATKSSIAFAEERLRFKWGTDHASQTGKVYGIGDFDQFESLDFNVDATGKTYRVESPDAVVPGSKAKTILRYADNNMSAAIGRRGAGGVIVVGFPFETILDPNLRDALMKRFLDYVQ